MRGRALTLTSVLAALLIGVAALALAHAAGLPAGLAWSDEIAYAAATPFFLDVLREHGFERVSETAYDGRHVYAQRESGQRQTSVEGWVTRSR